MLSFLCHQLSCDIFAQKMINFTSENNHNEEKAPGRAVVGPSCARLQTCSQCVDPHFHACIRHWPALVVGLPTKHREQGEAHVL